MNLSAGDRVLPVWTQAPIPPWPVILMFKITEDEKGELWFVRDDKGVSFEAWLNPGSVILGKESKS